LATSDPGAAAEREATGKLDATKEPKASAEPESEAVSLIPTQNKIVTIIIVSPWSLIPSAIDSAVQQRH